MSSFAQVHNQTTTAGQWGKLANVSWQRARRMGLVALTLLVCLALLGGQPPANATPALMRGFSARDFDNLYYWNSSLTPTQRAQRVVDDIKKAGASWWRPHVIWGKVEPTLLYPTLTRSQVTSSLVNTYIARTNWSFYDNLVTYANQQGIQIMFVLAAGYIAPFNQMPMYNGRPVTPRSDVSIGPEAYKANAYLHARAVVRKYKASVHWWQIENELNMAGWQTQFPVGAGYTWREGAEWWSSDFCQSLLTALRDAVKAEDSSASATLNFHQLNKSAINAWAPLLDAVGYDYYPSNVATDDLYAELVDVQNRAGAGKPVLLLETGYDPGAGTMTTDKQRNFEDWIMRSYLSAVSAGLRGNVNLAGYFYFTLATAEIDQDGEHMGLIENTNAYKWGYDLIQDLYSSSYAHTTQAFNDFEGQNGFSACAYATAQASATAYDGSYSVKVATSSTGNPGTSSRCVQVTRPSGATMDLTASDRMGFFVYYAGGSQTVRITVVDASGKVFSSWSDVGNNRNTKTMPGKWTLMTYPTASITGIDKTKVKEIRLGFYWAGTYYVDRVTRIK